MIIPDSETADAHKYRTLLKNSQDTIIGSTGRFMVYRCDDPNFTFAREHRRIAVSRMWYA